MPNILKRGGHTSWCQFNKIDMDFTKRCKAPPKHPSRLNSIDKYQWN